MITEVAGLTERTLRLNKILMKTKTIERLLLVACCFFLREIAVVI